MGEAAAVEVSVIVVSFNSRALTLACLDSLAREVGVLAPVSCEVIVVDNGSSDGSATDIEAHPLRPRLVALSENVGFAAANNLAIRHARGRLLLLLNPDTVVLPGALFELLAFARATPAAQLWGGRTLYPDGRLNSSSCWARMSCWTLLCRASGLTRLFEDSRLFNGEAYGGWRRDSVREVDIVSGSFLLITHELWQRLGGFDPLYFMYGEDADLCLRARRIGARPAITPAATIVHYGGAFEATRADKMAQLLTAKATLIRRHWPAPLVPLGILLLSAWPLTRWLAHRAAAALSRSEKARRAADAWREIWGDRAAWRRGYLPASVTAPSPTALETPR